MQSIRYSCPMLIKLEISRHIFEKYSNIIFNEWSRSMPSDRQQRANSRFLQFCERG